MSNVTLIAMVIQISALFGTLGETQILRQAQSQILKGPAFLHLVDENAAPQKQEEQASQDKSIKSQILTIKLALKADPLLFPYDIEVDVQDKTIELSGKVSTESEKKVAHRLVTIMTNRAPVTNAIEVDKELVHILEEKRDETITRTLQERFTKSKTLSEAKFDIKTEKGVVSLRGSTRFQVILLEAAQAAKEVPGVRAILIDQVRIESSDQ